MIETFEKATAEAKADYCSTLYQVAKMKAEFQLLKSAIINNLTLNYTGDELRLKDDRLIIEIMYLLEAEEMDNTFSYLKAKDDEAKNEGKASEPREEEKS